MKFDKIFLAMLIVLVASSIGIAVAAEGTAGSHTFTVPDVLKLQIPPMK